jgi:hypothetical protein
MRNLYTRNFQLCLVSSLLWANYAFAHHADSSSEFEVFVGAEAFHGSGQARSDVADPLFDADLIFGLTRRQFRVFGEYYATSNEHDLERLQLGFEFLPETVLWFGRFHEPGSAWNTQHHHGQYLQTAITRPFIERWEDESGLIPQHITGALFESRQSIGKDSALQISGGIGAAPSLTNDVLEPINLIGNNPGRHLLSVTGRLAYLPEYVGASSAGLLFGHDELALNHARAAAALQTSRATLSIYGVYIDWNEEPWRLIAADYYIDVNLDQTNRSESFISGYLQLERQLPRRLTIFGRFEDSSRMQESRYVALFGDRDRDIEIAVRRKALGLRWDYARRQALTLEFSRVVTLTQQSDEVRAQWSAAFP